MKRSVDEGPDPLFAETRLGVEPGEQRTSYVVVRPILCFGCCELLSLVGLLSYASSVTNTDREEPKSRRVEGVSQAMQWPSNSPRQPQARGQTNSTGTAKPREDRR